MKSYTIPSRSDPNKCHRVQLDDNGFDIDCECANYKFRHRPCHHIKIAQMMFESEGRKKKYE